MSEIGFMVTGRGKIEVSSESNDNYWIVEISHDGNLRLLRNMQPVETFPKTPLTKRLIAAAGAIREDAIAYLKKCWEQTPPKPWDDETGRKAWWKMKQTVESF